MNATSGRTLRQMFSLSGCRNEDCGRELVSEQVKQLDSLRMMGVYSVYPFWGSEALARGQPC